MQRGKMYIRWVQGKVHFSWSNITLLLRGVCVRA